MLKNFKKGFDGDYRMKLTLQWLRPLCEIDWLSFNAGWLAEGTTDREIIGRVFRVVTGVGEQPGHTDQFPYIDSWLSMIQTHPKWLQACFENYCKTVVARIKQGAIEKTHKARPRRNSSKENRKTCPTGPARRARDSTPLCSNLPISGKA